MSGEALTIGEVIGRLAADFPDLTVSKIRYLESGGLISPGRTPAGYRRFSEEDVEKLRWVLAAQRDQYLPLKVIRQHLAADGPRVTAGDADAIVAALTSGAEPAAGMDPDADVDVDAAGGAESSAAASVGRVGGSRVGEPRAGESRADDSRADSTRTDSTRAGNVRAGNVRTAVDQDRPRLPPASGLTPPLPPLPRARPITVGDPEFFVTARSDVGELHLSRDGLARTAGVSGSFLADLIAYGLLPNAEDYGGDAVIIVRAASALTEYGLEPRHLRPLLTGARNTAGLLGTLLPTRRHDGVTGSGRQAAASRAASRTAEASAAAVKLYAALLRAELSGSTGGSGGTGGTAPAAPGSPAATASIPAPASPVAPAPEPPSASADTSPTPVAPASRASSGNPGMPGGPASR